MNGRDNPCDVGSAAINTPERQGIGMVKHSSDKKNKLDRRDVKQTRLALRLLDGEELSASKLESAEERRGLKKTSLHRTFGRDLKAIGAEGIPLNKRRDGTSTFYQVDEALLAGPLDNETDEYSRVVATLARGLLTEPGTPNPRALGSAIVRSSLSTGAGTGIRGATDANCDPKILSVFEEGLSTRREVTVTYKAKGDGKPAARTFRTYGIFSLAGYTFVFGRRLKDGVEPEERTYNLSRVSHAVIKGNAGSYKIPKGFSIEDHRYLPFEIESGEQPQTARFYIPRKRAKTAPSVTRKRNVEHTKHLQGGSVIWETEICNTQAAAEWAIENGLIPIEPASLVATWQSILEGARQK